MTRAFAAAALVISTALACESSDASAPTASAGAGNAGTANGTAGTSGAAPGNDAGNTAAGDATGGAGAAGAGASDAGDAGDAGFQSLFNGVDLTHWVRYLGKPSEASEPLGVDNDPSGVYSVVQLDGEPAIRISGEVWGSLISTREFCNFQLRAQYKWGSGLWPPLNAADSGIMFLSTGPFGAVNAGGNALSDPIGSGGFLVSVEYQLTHAEVGALYNLGPIAFATTAHTPRAELPTSWNQIEIVSRNDEAVLSLNGQEVTRGSGFRLAWPNEPKSPLTCGKLQLQSEGAEIYFRHVELAELP